MEPKSCPGAGQVFRFSMEAAAHSADPEPVPSEPLLSFTRHLPLLEGTTRKNPCPRPLRPRLGDRAGAAAGLVPRERGKGIQPAEYELPGTISNAK